MGIATNPDHLAGLLLSFYRDPVPLRAQLLGSDEALANLDVVVRLALGKPVDFQQAAHRGAAAAAELESAASFFIRQNLFRENATHYQVLGLTSDATADAVRDNFRLLMQLVHPDRQGDGSTWSQRFPALVNRANAVLKNPDSRAAYDRQLTDSRSAPDSAARAPIFPLDQAVAVRARQRVRPPVLPEWLTAGVGGFLRDHPAPAIFGVLIAVSALAIILVLVTERESMLTRDASMLSSAESGGRRAGAPQQPTYIKASGAPSLSSAVGIPVAPVDSARVVPVAEAQSIDTSRVLPVAEAQASVVEVAAAQTSTPPLPAGAAGNSIQAARPVVAEPLTVTAPSGPGNAGSREMITAAAPAPSRLAMKRAETPEPPAAPLRLDRRTPAAPIGVQSTASSASSMKRNPLPTMQQLAVAPTVPTSATTSSALASTPTASASATASVAPAPAASPSPILALAKPVLPSAIPDAVGELPPSSAEVEALIAAFISSYEGGHGEAVAALFDVNAQVNQAHGQSAIRNEYDELFSKTVYRRIALKQLRWRAAGEHTNVSGEIGIKTIWRDGREADQRMALDIQLVRRDGKAVIARLTQQVRN